MADVLYEGSKPRRPKKPSATPVASTSTTTAGMSAQTPVVRRPTQPVPGYASPIGPVEQPTNNIGPIDFNRIAESARGYGSVAQPPQGAAGPQGVPQALTPQSSEFERPPGETLAPQSSEFERRPAAQRLLQEEVASIAARTGPQPQQGQGVGQDDAVMVQLRQDIEKNIPRRSRDEAKSEVEARIKDNMLYKELNKRLASGDPTAQSELDKMVDDRFDDMQRERERSVMLAMKELRSNSRYRGSVETTDKIQGDLDVLNGETKEVSPERWQELVSRGLDPRSLGIRIKMPEGYVSGYDRNKLGYASGYSPSVSAGVVLTPEQSAAVVTHAQRQVTGGYTHADGSPITNGQVTQRMGAKHKTRQAALQSLLNESNQQKAIEHKMQMEAESAHTARIAAEQKIGAMLSQQKRIDAKEESEAVVRRNNEKMALYQLKDKKWVDERSALDREKSSISIAKSRVISGADPDIPLAEQPNVVAAINALDARAGEIDEAISNFRPRPTQPKLEKHLSPAARRAIGKMSGMSKEEREAMEDEGSVPSEDTPVPGLDPESSRAIAATKKPRVRRPEKKLEKVTQEELKAAGEYAKRQFGPLYEFGKNIYKSVQSSSLNKETASSAIAKGLGRPGVSGSGSWRRFGEDLLESRYTQKGNTESDVTAQPEWVEKHMGTWEQFVEAWQWADQRTTDIKEALDGMSGVVSKEAASEARLEMGAPRLIRFIHGPMKAAIRLHIADAQAQVIKASKARDMPMHRHYVDRVVMLRKALANMDGLQVGGGEAGGTLKQMRGRLGVSPTDEMPPIVQRSRTPEQEEAFQRRASQGGPWGGGQ